MIFTFVSCILILSKFYLISTPTNAHTQNSFTLKHLKLLQHVSIFLGHPQGATLFLAKITFLKYTHWLFSYINFVLSPVAQHTIHTARRTLSDVQLTQYDMLPQH